uniref:N-acetylgalactosaminide beta-1,3-galactosyltransferase n=1 Tax=Panagrellus redivivus TaxID=6233 RepID=A0A7E4V6J9_PANRE
MRVALRDLIFLTAGICLAVFPYLLLTSSSTCGTMYSKIYNSVAKIDSSWILPSPEIQSAPLNTANEFVSDLLFKNVRIFCFIINTKNGTELKAIHVNATWAKRCNKHVFVSALEEYDLPTLDLGLSENRSALFPKVVGTLKHIYKNELEKFDFFLKADIDTYFVMDNLRFLLLPYSRDDALHFGCRFYHINQYMSGGAGYVFSREAVRLSVEKGFSKIKQCGASARVGEDIEIGACMNALNVTAVDTRDSQGRHRFMPFSPMTHLIPGPTPPDHKQYFHYNYTQGADCCSDYIVSFHYVTSPMMYVIDTFLHRFRRIGSVDELWAKESRRDGDVISALKRLSSTQMPKDKEER